jgi:2-keto-4-pentenoate hydratase/2-oxohepta-3-ene-1,7-dioic acid hydratase in catechol pathway
MRLVSYLSDDGPRMAAVRDDGYVDLNRADSTIPASVKAFLAGGPTLVTEAQALIASGDAMPPDAVPLLPPVPDPQKIICVGLNYADHAAESGATVGDEPVIFNKFPTALLAHGDSIRLPQIGADVDFEAELVAVIGIGGKNIPRQAALDHVAGYACGHDVSARDWQHDKPGGQWLLGKSFDSFAPLGPELVTADEVGDPHALDIRLRLNGQVMQDSNTQQLIFSVDYLVSYISQVCTLMPGDLIYTGTPPGVGMARRPPVLLKAGDVVEVEIEKVGVLSNPVQDEEAP